MAWEMKILKKTMLGEVVCWMSITRHLIVVAVKEQKLKGGKNTNKCTVNRSLNCIIIFDAVHCNKDHLNAFSMFSKENYAE